MQVLHSILQIGSSGTRLTDEYGSENGVSLEVMLGTAVRLEFDLRQEVAKVDGQLPVFPAESMGDCANYFALDSKSSNSNAPALLKYSGISLETDSAGHNILTVELPGNTTDEVIAVLAGQTSADFRAEIGGVNADGLTVFAWQFDLTVRSRVYLGNGDETVINDPEYYTAVQTVALINAKGEEISGELKKILDESAGSTPEKGVDYWTEEDKAEIKAYVDEAILNGSW